MTLAFTIIRACQVWLKFVRQLKVSRRKGIFVTYIRAVWSWPLTYWHPKLTSTSCPWTTWTNWHQNQFIRFRNIVYTRLVTDDWTVRMRTLCLCLPVWHKVTTQTYPGGSGSRSAADWPTAAAAPAGATNKCRQNDKHTATAYRGSHRSSAVNNKSYIN